MDNPTDCNSPVEQQPETPQTNTNVKPNLAQFKKSWGFRRSTIAKREFMDEVGDLDPSPPLVRKIRGRKSKTPSQQTTPTARDGPKAAACSSKSVLDELEWSAPSSPASEESKPTSETSAGGSMDPCMWQNFGSAFHTALSLLGGPDGSLVVATPNVIEVSDDEPESPPTEPLEESDFPSQAVDILDDLKSPVDANEDDDVVSISSREDRSSEITKLLDIKKKLELEIQEHTKRAKGGRGKVRGKGRGRGRGRGRGKGRGRGRGKTAGIQEVDNNNELMIRVLPEQPLQQVEDEELNLNLQVPPEMAQMCFDLSLSTPHTSGCTIDRDQAIAGQFDNAPEDRTEESVVELSDTNAVCRICEEKQNNRSMICCTGCQGWFHGDCVGDMKTEGKEYICLVCIEPNLLQADLTIQPDLRMSPLKSLMQSPPAEDNEELENPQTQSTLEMMEVKESPLLLKTEPEPDPVSQSSSPDCIGPSCSKPALPESVYCGSDCIMQHAAATIKNLSVPKAPKTRARAQRKAAPARAPAKAPRGNRASKRLANRDVSEEAREEEEHPEPESCQSCDPSVTEAQATQCNASADEDHGTASAVSETATSKEAHTVTSPNTPAIPATASPHKPAPAPPLKESTSPPKPTPAPLLKESTPPPKPAPAPPPKESIPHPKPAPAPLPKESTPPPKPAPAPPPKESTPPPKPAPAPPPEESIPHPKPAPAPPPEESIPHPKPAPAPLPKESTPHPKPAPAPPPKESTPTPKPAPDPAQPQHPLEKPKEPINNKNVSKPSSSKVNSPKSSTPSTPPTKPVHPQTTTKQTKPPVMLPPAPAVSRMHETGAIVVKKTAYVIPKKTPAPQPLSDQAPAPTPEPTTKPSLAPVQQTETRNLPVPPAPSAPSSRLPSQPNNQIRQSIQRSLVGILFKRVCDTEELDMSEKDVGKLVTNIETEMFNIFRNTDSKYMNKYRTIMFNLKDPKNKGLLFRLVQGEISPFRLVRMSQKDMQAIQLPEPSPKEVKNMPSVGGSLQKPEPVKLDLPSLIQTRTDRTKNVSFQEQKKPVPDPVVKSKTSQPIQAADILTCMLKDTTAEHHTHLFDVKCKICTGQMLQEEVGEPAQKKKKVSEDKREPLWKRSKRDDSPLRAPPDSPDSPVPHFTMGSPVLTIVESPASPVTQDSPASPTMDTPASPVMESPASPSSDDRQSAPMKSYTPVVIPSVSTVSITRRDPRTAASRYTALTNSSAALSEREAQKSDSYFPLTDTSSPVQTAPPVSLPSITVLPKSILTKPSHSGDPRLYASSSRNSSPKISSEGGPAHFLAKQDILWKGFLNMLTIAKFVTKGYLVSGSAEPFKTDLPDTIQIGGRILPKTVWDYVAKLKTSVTKELCVIRFQPATDEEEVAYVSLFSYFSSRGRFGVVANNNRSIKDMYLFPLSAKEALPAVLQPLEGPGFEKNRPNLLMGLAVIQKTKRPGSLSTEVEEKRPKGTMSSDPSWIPKPPSLYGSNKVDDFEPYDPEIPINITPPCSPPRSTFSSASFVTTTSVASVSQSKTNKESIAKTDTTTTTTTTTSDNVTPLQTILKQLFPTKQTESKVSLEPSSTIKAARPKISMVDPIVQQFGGKTTIKEIEEEDNDDLDRPYDPEEEYDPAGGYGGVPKSNTDIKKNIPEFSEDVDYDVAYDPEDETIFEDIGNEKTSKKMSNTTPTLKSNPPQVHDCPQGTPAPVSKPTPSQTLAPVVAAPAPACTVPTGAVVISAETLTEQQRMLEELNRQIEEQKRQLKEQEEALRQQREAVGMFMAKFSVSDSLVSPSSSLPLTKLVAMQSGATDAGNNPVVDTTLEKDNFPSTIASETDIMNDKSDTQEANKQEENEELPSPGEIGDSDVAYDPEDESLFDEIQAGMLEKPRSKSRDSSVSKTEQRSSRSRKRKYSPKRQSNRETGHHRSPSRRTQRRSPSRSRRRRERDRHHKSERTSSRHRSRDRSERHRTQGDSTSQTRSRRRRRSLSSQRNKHTSLSPRQKKEHFIHCQQAAPQPTNPDENYSPYSPDKTNYVNTEETRIPTTTETQEQTACNDNIPGDLKQVKWATDLMMDGKLDSLTRLRELEPPTRDSPQSPDPEPRFSEQESMDIVMTENNKEPEPIEEKVEIESYVKIESYSQPIQTPDICISNAPKPSGLVKGAAVVSVKVELNSEETISDNSVTKKLDDPKPLAVKIPPIKNEESQEDIPCKDSIPGLGDLEHVLQASREGSPALTNQRQDANTLKDISIKSNRDNSTFGTKGMHEQFSSRHQMFEETPNADRDIRNRRESANSNFSPNTPMGSTRDQHLKSDFGESGGWPSLERDFSPRNPNMWSTGPRNLVQIPNLSESQFDTSSGGDFMGTHSRGEELKSRGSRSYCGSDGGFSISNLSGQSAETFIDGTKPELSGADSDGPWKSSGPAFREVNMNCQGPPRGGFGRGGPVENPGHYRGSLKKYGESDFDRRGPMDGPKPHRGGFGGAGFGRGGELFGPMDGPEHHKREHEEPDYDSGCPTDGPGPHRGGLVGPGFGRGGPINGPGPHRGGFRRPYLGRGGPMDGPGPHRGGWEELEFDRGPTDWPGPHRGRFGGPGFGRGGPMDGPGPQRGGLEELEIDRGSMDGPELRRGGFGEPRFGRGGEHHGQMDSRGIHRGGFGGSDFGRGGEHRGGPIDGPGSHRGGFVGPGFGRDSPMGGPGSQREGHEEPEFDRGPVDGPGPHRGRFGGRGFGRGGKYRGPIDGLGPRRGGFGGPRFGNSGEHGGGSIEYPGPHREAQSEPDLYIGCSMDCPGGAIDDPGNEELGFDRGGPMDGPGLHRGGFGGPRICRAEEYQGGDGLSDLDGPGPHRRGFGGPGFERGCRRRGPMDNPEKHRGRHSETDFDRDGLMDDQGPCREGFVGLGIGRDGEDWGGDGPSDFDSGALDGPEPRRGEFGGLGFCRGGEHRGPMDGPGQLIEEHEGPDFDRIGPMDGSGPHRDRFGGTGFVRGGPKGDPRSHRGGHGYQRFGRGGEHINSETDDYDSHKGFGGPSNGPGSNRGGRSFGRGGEHTGGQSDGPGLNSGEFDGLDFDRGGEQSEQDFGGPDFCIDEPMDGRGPNRGRRGRPGFGRGGEHRGGQVGGPGTHRRGPEGVSFGRGHEHGCSPIDGSVPHRGGFGGPGFSRDGENRGGTMCGPRPRRGGHRGIDFDRPDEYRWSPMDGPGPLHSGMPRGQEFRGDEQENPGSQRAGPSPDFGHEGEICDLGSEKRGYGQRNSSPCFRGPQNEYRNPNNRGPREDGQFGDSRVGPEDRWNRGDFAKSNQRPDVWRPENDGNGGKRNRQDYDRPERPCSRRDRVSHDRERDSGRDMRDDQYRPLHRSLSRDRSAHRRDQESGQKSDLPKVDSEDPKSESHSSHRKESELKSTSGATGSEQSDNSAVSPNANMEQKRHEIPSRHKTPLLPTPSEGPIFPFQSRGRGGQRR
ncbi:uncharacterized protein [Eucyclogobius newberryi]|uniref:uncharacterized protein n=1 Tax=Eucyclogobius newberryi TaxID=166745 RepID=UPI003B593F20